jgi:hypothetical protein
MVENLMGIVSDQLQAGGDLDEIPWSPEPGAWSPSP